MKTLDLRNCCFLSTSLKLLLVFFTFLNVCYSFSHSSFLLQKQVKLSFTALFQRVLPKKQDSFSRKGQNYHKIHIPLDILWKRSDGRTCTRGYLYIMHDIYLRQISRSDNSYFLPSRQPTFTPNRLSFFPKL